ncbi:MAG: hypothetical protein MUP98_01100, partial [Candidatus Aminicenantes bacterium]|nr:hypothetical protein [Candidatus Aminicenantes bacterium]
MKKCILTFFAFSLLCLPVFSQIVVTSPSTVNNVKACADYADETLLDRWDMNERTDLGWRIFNTVEMPNSYLTNISFQNGIFSAKSVYTSGGENPDYSDANISILDSPYLYSAMLGKTGKKYPIDADKYTVLVIRMYLEPDIYGPWGQLLWSTDTIYNGSTTSGAFIVKNNWIIYFIDIPALGIAAGSDPWSGTIDSLRMDPILQKDKEIKIDWIRLVQSEPGNERTISWTGNSGAVDIYLDDDTDSKNGNLGLLAEQVSGISHTFLAGGLAPGDYYVAIAPYGTSNYSYSPGYFHINDVPIFRFTQPSAEGSTTDFITVATSDPWDMANAADVEHTELIVNPQFTTINYEDLVGNASTNHSVYKGTSVVSPSLVGDPQVFFLHFLYRGATYQIDTSRYHNLVFKMGISGTQSVSEGSIARVMWRNKNESVENVSEDIIIRHLPDKWVMNKIVCDMNNLPIEAGAGSPSHSGWTGELDSLRIDPHEFPNPRDFFFDDVKLTTDVTANTSLSVEWILSDSDSTPLVSLYRDTDSTGYDGTLIVANVPISPGSDSYLADVSGYAEGKYWLYALVSDGTNENRSYSTGPVFINHDLIPIINLSKRNIYLAAEQNGPTTSKEKVFITNSGQGALNWQAIPDSSWNGVTPTNGSGDG